MSQEKVDRYKKEKASRKQTMRKEKMLNFFRRCMLSVLGLALVGWLGYSAYDTYVSSRPAETAQIDYSVLEELSQRLAEAEPEAAE